MTQRFPHIHGPCWTISLSASVPMTMLSCYTTYIEYAGEIALNVGYVEIVS